MIVDIALYLSRVIVGMGGYPRCPVALISWGRGGGDRVHGPPTLVSRI